jgi:hypothetical protein
MAETSEPASGSVTAIAATISPLMAGTRKRRFSSSEPNWCSDGVAMSVCTLMPMATPALSQRPISSNITAV